MKLKIALLAVVFAIAAPVARADVGGCEVLESSHGHVTVRQAGMAIRYSFRMSGRAWIALPYGHHASGLLECEDCGPAGGMYFLGGRGYRAALGAERGLDFPYSSSARLAQRLETIRYPFRVIDGANLTPHGGRDDVQVGPLRAYAAKFLILPHWIRREFPGASNPQPTELLVIYADDGCVPFTTTLVVGGPVRAQDDWSVLESFLSSAVIIRHSRTIER